MGLDFNGSNAHWSYGGFNRFREKLGAQLGIELRKMAGFADPGISWNSVAKDPIISLLCHSDCDGKLTAKECAEIAPRLLQMVVNWPDDDDRKQALLLAKGMKNCARRKKPLEFC